MANIEKLSNQKLAVLIDADNAQALIIQELLAEVSRYGIASVKRAYGDWTTTNLKGWKETLHRMAIQPMQQFSYTSGKNSTDSSLIIDAMDLLHEGKLDGFCLVSSDSDFTRLATRIREAGLVVYGFGEKKTPEAFVAACDKFIYTEILRPLPDPLPMQKVSSDAAELGKAGAPAPALRALALQAVNAAARDDGWAPLSSVGSFLLKTNPSFDPRNYGCQKLGELLRQQPYLEVRESPVGVAGNLHLDVRLAPSKSPSHSR
ncbi:MAG: Maebl [Massilia sp.]|jgi:hypothetical protein|nr:Maebl [Massilia sp.]